jgi:hypothetical protein
MKMSAAEQRVNIKFCFLLYRSPSETLQMLEKAYGKAVIKTAQVYEWQKRLRDGHEADTFSCTRKQLRIGRR